MGNYIPEEIGSSEGRISYKVDPSVGQPRDRNESLCLSHTEIKKKMFIHTSEMNAKSFNEASLNTSE